LLALHNEGVVGSSTPAGLDQAPGDVVSRGRGTEGGAGQPPSVPPAAATKKPTPPAVAAVTGGDGGGSSNSGGSNGGSATGGGSTRSQPEHHGWVHWPSWHTVSEVAVGVAVGLAVTVTVATGCLGVVGCAVLAAVAGGAAGGAATYANSVALGDDEFSVRGLATSSAIGGAAGGLTAGASAVVGSVAKSVFSRGVAAAAESGAATAERAAAPAAKNIGESGASKAGAARSAARCATNSFAATTTVLMADGSATPISTVKIGDKVKAVDPATGKAVTGTVTATYVNNDTAFTDLTFTATVVGKPVKTTLHTTSHHRIWDQSTRSFSHAIDLPTGHQVRTTDGHTWTLTGHRSWTGHERMYDITVNDAHTFYVLAGNTPILVHNCGEAAEAASGGSQSLYHYTNEAGHDGITSSGEMRPSLKANNPKDARYGDGQYLTDIVPGTKTPGQLSAAFLRVGWLGRNFTHYVEIDVSGLNVVEGRPGVFVIPNNGPLDLTGRILSSGRN
jgi:hypothetical protein